MAGWQGRPWAWALLLCVAGCARGGSADPLQPYKDSGSASHSSDAGEDSGSNVVPYDPDAATGDGDSSGDGDVSMPHDAGMKPDAGGSSDDAGGAICTLQNTCDQARLIGSGSIDGDQNNDLEQTTGTRSEWLAIDVKEAANSTTSVTFTVSLSIQGDANYDLFIYYPDKHSGANNETKCDTPSNSSSNPSNASESVMVNIGDTFAADDSRHVRIEVRHISGDCGTWTLTVAGHT
jgi:hypothetical protein